MELIEFALLSLGQIIYLHKYFHYILSDHGVWRDSEANNNKNL